MESDLASVKRRIDLYVAARVDDMDDCADLSQLCLIKVWRKGHTFRGDATFDSWLYRLVHNAVMDWARREAQRRRTLDLVERLDRREHDLEKTTLDRLGVQRLLSAMSGRDRRIVELTYLHALTSAEVGGILGLAPSSVRCRLLRIRRDCVDPAEPTTRRVVVGQG